MSNPRTIKKYPNRRLYDTTLSRYITLQDVSNLVREGTALQVLDQRTNGVITREILLQILSEQERGPNPLFSDELLLQLIRSAASGPPASTALRNRLENVARSPAL